MDGFVLARLREIEACRVTVCLAVLSEMLKARIPVACASSRFRIDLIEVIHHHRHGVEKAVEVHAVEPGLA